MCLSQQVLNVTVVSFSHLTLKLKMLLVTYFLTIALHAWVTYILLKFKLLQIKISHNPSKIELSFWKIFLKETFFYVTAAVCFLDSIAAKTVSSRRESVVSDWCLLKIANVNVLCVAKHVTIIIQQHTTQLD